MKAILVFFIVIYVCSSFVRCDDDNDNSEAAGDFQSAGRKLVEQGRTMVHHAVKRFMIILPAIFFKLGIAFTLLVLVTIVAVNNGVIGFLLLVVGLSSVLARLQGSSAVAAAPIALPYISAPYHHHHQVWDRSDADGGVDSASVKNKMNYGQYSGYLTQSQQYSPQLSTYYARYGGSKAA